MKHDDDFQFPEKINVRVSEKAIHILRTDQNSFEMLTKRENGGGINKALLLKIFIAHLDTVLSQIQEYGKTDDCIINSLNESREEYIRPNTTKLKNCSIPIEVWKFFQGKKRKYTDDTRDPHKLFSYVIEDYTRRLYLERERIYFYSTYNIIMSAIKSESIIKFHNSSGRSQKILPLDIRVDEWSTYNYILGIDNESEKASVNRLSRISDVVITNKKANRKLILHRENIENEVAQKGIMFISSQKRASTVQMTDHGKYLFNTMVFMRPAPVNIKQIELGEFCWEYTFNCTALQIRNYFFKFGKEIAVIEPEELRSKFKQDYLDALKKYLPPDDIHKFDLFSSHEQE